MKIVTEFVYPPIPSRSFDWSAIDDDTYDGPGCRIGFGATEQAAINDLLEQLEEGAAWNTGNTFEYLTALVVSAEENARLAELHTCNQTENLAGDSGERSGECGSLALWACDACGSMCEYHERFCSHGKERL